MRRRSETSKKLVFQKETLRALQQRTLSEQELRAVAGGMSATCSDCCAPSQRGC